MLKNRILNKETGFLFYGLTPPKVNTEEDKIRDIANKQIERLIGLQLDGLVLYDIQDESSRTDSPRPFPFMSTLAPDFYSTNYLTEIKIPKIIYNSIGKYSNVDFKNWIDQKSDQIECSVLVGTPSNKQNASLSLHDAYKIWKDSNSNILLGGVTIPERHIKKGDEHIRVFDKIDRGCTFFISQCVYSANNTKNFLSDYYYASIENKRELVPIIFTLTPCGSIKTLQFMEWLGIDIPKWLNNDLKHSNDILSKSVEICKSIAIELLDYCKNKNIPIGFNIESVAIRREEIEASIELVKSIKTLINK
jgi:hypothetical protein